MKPIFTGFSRKLLPIVCLISGLVLQAGCATKDAYPAVDAETSHLAEQAKSFFEMNRPAQAASLYQKALDRARALNNDALVARLAYNLGACRLEHGDARGACEAFEEAVYTSKAAGLPAAESQLLRGYALLELGKTRQVLALCTEAIESQVSPDMSMRIQLLRAKAYLQNGQTDRAAESLQQVIAQTKPKTAPAIQVQAAHIEGKILSRRGQPNKSANAFLREAKLWAASNQPAKAVTALTCAANEQKRAKDVSGEADSRYRTARALLGLQRFDEASAQLELLEAIPEDCRPPALRPLVPHLRQAIEKNL